MKKQTLFNLTSMPKLITVVILIVMIGTLFGAVTYLLQLQPQLQQRIPISPIPSVPSYQVSDEVIVETDKTEYKMVEEVKITIKNNFNQMGIFLSNISVEEFNNDKWEKIRFDIECPCSVGCSREVAKVLPKESRELVWDQKNDNCLLVENGKYRLKIDLKSIGLNSPLNKIYYSNEFTIKEKSALDPRCGEKVEGVGYCRDFREGYEFDSTLEKCIKKGVSGCSFEIPFETLEECQEVCEEKDCMNEDDECTVRDIDCCDGFKKALLINENEVGECSTPLPCGSICIPCGNGICDKDKRENKCNCPEDCNENINSYYCPNIKNIDCMPIVSKENELYCEKDHRRWIEENCDVFYTD